MAAGKRSGYKGGEFHTSGLRVGQHRVLESIWIPGNQLSLQTSGTAAAAGQVDDVPVTVHSSGADDEATFSVLIPNELSPRATMEVEVYWNSSDTESKTVAWDIDYRVTASGSDTGAGSTSNVTTGAEATNSTANAINVSSKMTIPASDLTPGSVFHGLFYNDDSEGTMDEDSNVIGLRVVFKDPVI